MATYKRISENTEVKPGSTTTDLSMEDIVLMQKQAGGTDDKKATIASLHIIPLVNITVPTSGATFTSSCINYNGLIVRLGMELSVSFSKAYTGTTAPSVTFTVPSGTSTASKNLPLKAHGVAVNANFNGASNTYRTIIRTTSTTDASDTTKWYLDLDTDITTVSSTAVTLANSSVVPLNSALGNYQPIVTNVIAGGSEWDTEIFLNKSVQNTNNYKYKKTHLIMLSAINGYGDTVSSRLVLLSIGRSGNSITSITVSEKSAIGSISWINNIQFAPSNEETSANDNNTLVIKNLNTVSSYNVEVRFL